MEDLASVLMIALPIAVAICGLLLLRRAMSAPEDLAWRPLTDIVAGLAMLALAGFVFFLSCGTTGHDIRDSMRMACLHNLMQIGKGLQMYATDNDQRLPPRDVWCDAIEEYVNSQLQFGCPEMRNEPYAFMLNSHFGGRRLAAEPTVDDKSLVMCFDGMGGKNLYGSLYSVQYRHKGRTTLLFADGHAKPANKEEAAGYKWTPNIVAGR